MNNLDTEEEYDLCSVQGVNCICWKFAPCDNECNKNKEDRRRRKVKEVIGHKYLDVPLLDSKQSKDGKEWCDIIIFSNHIEQWQKVLSNHYDSIGYKLEENILPHDAHQLLWKNDGTTIISLNVYPKSGKFMIQPGQQNEERINTWLCDFPNFKSKVLSSLQSGKEKAKHHSQSGSSQNTPVSDTGTVAPDSGLPVVIVKSSEDATAVFKQHGIQLHRVAASPQSKEDDPDAEEILCQNKQPPVLKDSLSASSEANDIPLPNNVSPKDDTLTADDTSPKDDAAIGEDAGALNAGAERQNGESLLYGAAGLTVGIPPPHPIVNELLCFAQNRIESMDRDTLVQLCSDFYTFDVINSAKQLLYSTMKLAQTHRTRRGPNKSKASMNDITQVFLEMKVDNPPVFVAQNLSDIPPVTVSNMDSLKVLQEISVMKSQMATITNGHRDLLNALYKDSSPPSQLQELVDVELRIRDPPNSHEGGHDHEDSTSAVDSSEEEGSQVERDSQDEEAGDYEVPIPPPRPVFSRIFTRTKDNAPTTRRKGLYSDVARSGPPQGLQKQQYQLPLGQQGQQQRQSRHDRFGGNSSGMKATQTANNVLIGTGSHGLKASQPIARSEQNQRQCTGLFITRLAPKTTSDNISDHIWNVTGYSLKAERLQTRWDDYRSFYIRCDRRMRDNLLQANLWPKDVLVKPYYV